MLLIGSPRWNYGHLLLDTRHLLYPLQMGGQAGDYMIHHSYSQNICVQGSDVAHPGVAPQDPEDRTEHVYHKYYQVRRCDISPLMFILLTLL